MGYYDEYLEHGDRTWKHHKYIKKEPNGKGWKYYYAKTKSGIQQTKRVEAEEQAWTNGSGIGRSFKVGSEDGGTYAYDADSKSALKRTNGDEHGVVKYNVKNGKQLFDSYDEKTTVGKGNEVKREANITYGYLHRLINSLQEPARILQKKIRDL